MSNPIPELPPVTSARTSESFMRGFYVSPASAARIRGDPCAGKEGMRRAGVLTTRVSAHARQPEAKPEVTGIDARGANERGTVAVRRVDVHGHNSRGTSHGSVYRHAQDHRYGKSPCRPATRPIHTPQGSER